VEWACPKEGFERVDMMMMMNQMLLQSPWLLNGAVNNSHKFISVFSFHVYTFDVYHVF
jgi:hypothetical protein